MGTVACLKATGTYDFAAGLATVAILVLFLTGTQFIGMGVLGAYVGGFTMKPSAARSSSSRSESAFPQKGILPQATPVRSRYREEFFEAIFRHRLCRVHRQQPGRPPAGRPGMRCRATTTSPRATRSFWRGARTVAPLQAGPRRRARSRLPFGGHGGATSSSIWPPTPTFVSAPSTPARTSNRTRSPRSTCWRRCAPAACGGIAFSSTGSIYGEPRSSRRRKRALSPCRRRCTEPPSWPARG